MFFRNFFPLPEKNCGGVLCPDALIEIYSTLVDPIHIEVATRIIPFHLIPISNQSPIFVSPSASLKAGSSSVSQHTGCIMPSPPQSLPPYSSERKCVRPPNS